jgi:hypothetical protein
MENISFDSALLLNSSSTAPSQKRDRVYDFWDSIASGKEFEARYANLVDRIAC